MNPDYWQCNYTGSFLRPIKNVGDMFEFVSAPPRQEYPGEAPRSPDMRLVGKRGLVVAGPFQDWHEWGGIYEVLVEGKLFRYHGDFMEPIRWM